MSGSPKPELVALPPNPNQDLIDFVIDGPKNPNLSRLTAEDLQQILARPFGCFKKELPRLTGFRDLSDLTNGRLEDKTSRLQTDRNLVNKPPNLGWNTSCLVIQRWFLNRDADFTEIGTLLATKAGVLVWWETKYEEQRIKASNIPSVIPLYPVYVALESHFEVINEGQLVRTIYEKIRGVGGQSLEYVARIIFSGLIEQIKTTKERKVSDLANLELVITSLETVARRMYHQ